jgi:hypothetical protein
MIDGDGFDGSASLDGEWSVDLVSCSWGLILVSGRTRVPFELGSSPTPSWFSSLMIDSDGFDFDGSASSDGEWSVDLVSPTCSSSAKNCDKRALSTGSAYFLSANIQSCFGRAILP